MNKIELSIINEQRYAMGNAVDVFAEIPYDPEMVKMYSDRMLTLDMLMEKLGYYYRNGEYVKS